MRQGSERVVTIFLSSALRHYLQNHKYKARKNAGTKNFFQPSFLCRDFTFILNYDTCDIMNENPDEKICMINKNILDNTLAE